MELRGNAFQENWTLWLSHGEHDFSVQIRLGISISDNGFRRVSEAAATVFWKSGTDLHRALFRETHDISLFDFDERLGALRLGPCSIDLAKGSCSGKIQSKGALIQWNFLLRADPPPVTLPSTMFELRRHGQRGALLPRQWTASGSIEWPGQKRDFDSAKLTITHFGGKRLFENWNFLRALHWVGADQKPVDLKFVGLTARTPGLLGKITPAVRKFWFRLGSESEFFSGTAWGLGIKSVSSPTEWNIQLTKSNLAIHANFKSELRALSGMVREDTNGSTLYEYATGLGTGELSIYKDGKLEGNYVASPTVSFEHGTRTRAPYLPIQI